MGTEDPQVSCRAGAGGLFPQDPLPHHPNRVIQEAESTNSPILRPQGERERGKGRGRPGQGAEPGALALRRDQSLWPVPSAEPHLFWFLMIFKATSSLFL